MTSVDRSKAHATPVRAHRAAGRPGISLDAIRGRSALRPARWSRRKEISSARPILPRTLKLSAIYYFSSIPAMFYEASRRQAIETFEHPRKMERITKLQLRRHLLHQHPAVNQ